MIKLNLHSTPQNTKMVEIYLKEASEHESITKDIIQEALNLLYNEKVEILDIVENNNTQHLAPHILPDYKVKVKTSKGAKTALNFVCCFLDSGDIKKIVPKNNETALNNVKTILKNLKSDLYERNAVGFEKYAQTLIDKFLATSL